MATYKMLIDVDKCTGCYSCFLACKDEYCGNDYPGYAASQPARGHYWMRLDSRERGCHPKVKLSYIPTPCMQCANAPCIAAATDGAVYRRDDGIVIIDPEKAKGQRQIVSACPHRVIYWNEEAGLPQKCTFCAHLLDRGETEPRCVETCPTGALLFGDADDPDSAVSKALAKMQTETLAPEFDLNPSVIYAGIPKRFVAGEVVLSDAPDECAAGVSVALSGNCGAMETVTDAFGDFEFEGLPAKTDGTITVSRDGYKEKVLDINTRLDLNLGEIVLEKA